MEAREVEDLGWNKPDTINWISRSVHARETNPEPTLQDLIDQEESTLVSQDRSGDPNADTHRYVLGVLESFPHADRARKVSDIMSDLGEEYKWGAFKD